MTENTVSTLIFLIVIFVWLVLPAFIAHLNGRKWVRWFILGAILPIMSLVILALLPRPKDKNKLESSVARNTSNDNNNLSEDVGTASPDDPQGNLMLAELTNQAVGSLEFQIEIASAYVESGLDIGRFCRKYNVDQTALIAWTEQHLGLEDSIEEVQVENGLKSWTTVPTGNEQTRSETMPEDANNEIFDSDADKIDASVDRSELAKRSSTWFDATTNIGTEFDGRFAMSIETFQVEGPDDDGDYSMDISFNVENSSSEEISLIKKNLVLEQAKLGAVMGEINDREECLLDPGETLELSSWTRINEHCLDTSDENIVVNFFASFYSSENFRFNEIEVPNLPNTTTASIQAIDSNLVGPEIKISIFRAEEVPYDEEDDDPNEDKLELKISLENKSSVYLEEIETRVSLVARNGAEIDETSEQLEILTPHSGALLQPSFWGIKRSKLKDAKINVALKVHRLVGTQSIRETQKLTT